MKAADLMIGDWVLWRGTPLKIMSINDKTSRSLEPTVTGLITIDGKETIRRFDAKSLKPIPLTTEILEKNEYKIGKPYSNDIKYPCFVGIYPELKFQIALWEREKNGFWIELVKFANLEDHKLDSIIKKHFHYIHELQHALRLCGITEKRIKI